MSSVLDAVKDNQIHKSFICNFSLFACDILVCVCLHGGLAAMNATRKYDLVGDGDDR